MPYVRLEEKTHLHTKLHTKHKNTQVRARSHTAAAAAAAAAAARTTRTRHCFWMVTSEGAVGQGFDHQRGSKI